MQHERRRKKRVARRFNVKFGEHDLGQTGIILDISQDGAFISASRMPALGTRLHVQVQHGASFVLYEALVRRHRVVPTQLRQVTPMGFGVSFLAPAELFHELVPHAGGEGSGQVEYRVETAERLRDCWEKELRFGGLFLRSEGKRERDEEVVVELLLDFAGKRFELKAKVVQVISGVAPGFAVAFVDPAAVRAQLTPFLPPGTAHR